MILPTFNNLGNNEGLTDWTMTVQLDGRSFMLRFQWCDRIGAWYADILSPDGQVIRQGCRIVPDWPLFARLREERAPAGRLMCAWVGDGVPVVDRTNFGRDAKVVYLTLAECDEIRDAAAATDEVLSVTVV